MSSYTVATVEGIGEVTAGADLAAEIASRSELSDGDVLVVTSKVVSKAEGRVVEGRHKDEVLDEETDRILARRGSTSIVRTHHGLVMAAAGIDASNTDPGSLVLLPRDPDASARLVRDELAARFDVNVAVVVSDTSGRAWRAGQTDIAVGVAGLAPLDDHAGRHDTYGNELAVTAPALADEIAAAGDLAKGKLGRTPVAVVRGLAGLVLPRGEHGPGATVLVRDEAGDMFGYGAREAVMAALSIAPDLRGFGAPAPADHAAAALRAVLPAEVPVEDDGSRLTVVLGTTDTALGRHLVRTVCHAHAWVVDETDTTDTVVCRPAVTSDP